MKKSTKEYMSDLNKYKNTLKEYYKVLKSNKNFIPLVTIILFLSISMIITEIKQSGRNNSKELSIATNSAEESFYNVKYDEAILDYTKLQKEEEWPIWKLKIAEVYSVQGDFVKSNKMIEEIYQTRNKIIDNNKEKKDNLEIKDRELTNYIVFTTLMNGDSDKAVEYGEVFLKDYPDDKNLLKTMFTVYLVNQNKDKAKEVLANYSIENETAGNLADLARMNMLLDEYDKGFALLKNAWNKDKNEVKVFDVIAQITDYNQKDILNRILKLEEKEPEEIAYKMWIAKIYSMSKDSTEKAEELLEMIESEDVGSINLMLIKSNIYQNIGDTEKSKEIVDDIINFDKNSFISYHAAAWLDYNNEKYDEAFNNCEKSISINRDYVDNYGFLMPEIFAKQDKTEEAEPYFRTALYKEPFNFNIIMKTAEFYGNTMQDTTKALHYYDLASKINQNDADIYYNMALININNLREDEAIELLKKSISINNNIPKYHRALGTIYINAEKYEEALKEIRNAYSIDNADILTLNNAACYYVAIDGDVDRSMTNIKAAYDGINQSTTPEDKEIIIENYEKVKILFDAYNKRDGATLTVPQLKLFY